MGLAMIPQPALKMTHVVAETPFASDINIEELYVAPSLLAPLKKKPLGRATASGLFGGSLDLNVGTSSKISGPEAISAHIEFTDFQVKDMMKALQLRMPMTISGQGRLIASVDMDPNMKAQPDGDVALTVSTVEIPSFSIPLGMMPPLPLPGINLEKLVVKGKLKNGQFTFADTQIGSSKDELSAKISGTMDMRVFPGGMINVGLYNLAVDLNIKDSAQAKFGSMMSIVDGFLGKYGSKGANGKRYAFRIQANGFQDPAPKFSEL
jgi:type II secretion system protein N